jgi:RNA polymerase sigma factor (sigma-70 family)
VTPDDMEDNEIDVISEDELVEIEQTFSAPTPSGVERLTADLLTLTVPLMRAGEEAAVLIAAGDLPVERERELRRAARDGERAKERVFTAALPLIRNIARREFRRRQQWGSTIPLEDLTQDAIVGFFKGLAKFKPEAIRKSSTNYLGQWMLVEMRRSAESMDHDLQVGHDAAERFRRIRAIRSRLEVDLQRPPTDDEISAASRDPKYVTRPGMVGRAPGEDETQKVGKGVTPSQVEEERASRSRLGHVARFGDVLDREDASGDSGSVIDSERVVALVGGDNLSDSPESQVVEARAAVYMTALITRTLEVMNLPDAQKEIISRRYGLSPYEDESSAREISRVMNIHRERVSRVLSAFTDEMKTPGGSFHRVVSVLSDDDLQELGIPWISVVLGPWNPSAAERHKVPHALTEEISHTASSSVLWYRCDLDDVEFKYPKVEGEQAPDTIVCEACGGKAILRPRS